MSEHTYLTFTGWMLFACINGAGLGIYLLTRALHKMQDRIEYLEVRLSQFLDANGEVF